MAIKLPTVSCVPVAMRLPEEFVVTMELAARAAREVMGTFDTAREVPERVRPVPVRSLNDSPLTIKLVVEAVRNDEYAVEEEYGEVMRLVAVMLPEESMVVEAVPPTFNQLAENRVDEA